MDHEQNIVDDLRKRGRMKLKDEFIIQDIDDTQFMVSVGVKGFTGLMRNNETAAFIVNCLKKETTEEAIINALWQTYDAPMEMISADVRGVLDTLWEIHALAEE